MINKLWIKTLQPIKYLLIIHKSKILSKHIILPMMCLKIQILARVSINLKKRHTKNLRKFPKNKRILYQLIIKQIKLISNLNNNNFNLWTLIMFKLILSKEKLPSVYSYQKEMVTNFNLLSL